MCAGHCLVIRPLRVEWQGHVADLLTDAFAEAQSFKAYRSVKPHPRCGTEQCIQTIRARTSQPNWLLPTSNVCVCVCVCVCVRVYVRCRQFLRQRIGSYVRSQVNLFPRTLILTATLQPPEQPPGDGLPQPAQSAREGRSGQCHSMHASCMKGLHAWRRFAQCPCTGYHHHSFVMYPACLRHSLDTRNVGTCRVCSMFARCL